MSSAEVQELAEEVPEILSLLPLEEQHDGLELQAGTGRFTGRLAERLKSLQVVEGDPNLMETNQKANSSFGNVTFVQKGFADLEYPPNSFDLVFSNWLFMYLDDDGVRKLFLKILKWIRPGGHLFFRESCFHKSGLQASTTGAQKSVNSTSTLYRTPALYNALFQSVGTPSSDSQGGCGFELVLSRSIQAFVRHLNNSNQVCWLLQKVQQNHSANHGFNTFQEFLDNQQYSRNGILRYEKIFGRNFVSTGGKETTEEFVSMLNLKPGQYVLDVGSGIGGSAFYMAQKYGAEVLGIDLSANMTAIALERANEIKDKRVQFEVGDATKRRFPEATFDVIYSRDTILHIKDKKALFSMFLYWLKPGGKLLISDYCCSDGTWSEGYASYVAQRGYHLLSVPNYGKLLEEVGFVRVQAQDRTEQFVNVLRTEMARTSTIKEEILADFSQEDYDALLNGWNAKVQRCGQGDQKWGLFYAEKTI